MTELKHTLTINRTAWYLRYYMWLYDAREDEVNFCKLFWGILLSPAFLLLIAIFLPISHVLDKVERRSKNKPAEIKKKAAARRKARGDRLVGTVSASTSRVVMFLQAHPWILAPLRAVGWVVKSLYRLLERYIGVVAVTLSAALVVFVLYLAVTYLTIAALVLAGAVGLVVGVTVVIVLGRVGVYTSVYEYVLTPFGHGVKSGSMGFGSFMRTGYKAVKSNTCPKIEIR